MGWFLALRRREKGTIMNEQGNAELYDIESRLALRSGAADSARVVLSWMKEVLNPRSVVDVGCGNGAWLSLWREWDVDTVYGVDGGYVKPDSLMIPPECFQSADLRKPLALEQRFELAMCLEVAEHLPEDAASTLVDSLVQLSDVVLFSAAVPGQGGDGHLNEQWPSWWAVHFQSRGYVALESVRRIFWNRHEVRDWYRQNMMLCIRQTALKNIPALKPWVESNRREMLDVFSPDMWMRLRRDAHSWADAADFPPGKLLRALPSSLLTRLKRALNRS